jgi:hypothetical protein
VVFCPADVVGCLDEVLLLTGVVLVDEAGLITSETELGLTGD